MFVNRRCAARRGFTGAVSFTKSLIAVAVVAIFAASSFPAFAKTPEKALSGALLPAQASAAFPKIGFIGDSITIGWNQVGHTITPGVSDAAALTIKDISETKGEALTDAGIPWSSYDQGVSGSSTRDWLPSQPNGLYTHATDAFAAAFGIPNPKTNPVWILVMLGTNDVRSDNRFPPKEHEQNLQAITAALVGDGYNVIINSPPAFFVPTIFNGVRWDANSMNQLRGYLPADKSMVASFAKNDPGRVFMGDTSAFGYFAIRPRLFQEYGVYGGLHPSGIGGTQALAGFWAQAFSRANS
jgi:lysophospholipase L1-like esterase